MSLLQFYMSHLRLLAVSHKWAQVEEASMALDRALFDANVAQIENALTQLDNGLTAAAAIGPHQDVRQAREHIIVLRRLTSTVEMRRAA